ncbi:uncharacterized protein LOC135682015 isoform X2 [Rhopilema esculentum]|uniref:uncharacterized protein LOC135682015 isoform X2 n=1 Tax=Rhopilema esculentum TaxID=499914 RepID=UPI0031D37CEF
MMNQWLIIVVSICHAVTKAIALSNKQCDTEEPVRGILDLKQPTKPAQLINATSASSLADCSLLCCNVKRCNTYIWRNGEQCFLFICKSREKCKILPYEHTMTGYVNKGQSSIGSHQNTPQEGINSNASPLEKKTSLKAQTTEEYPVSNDAENTVAIKSVSMRKSPDLHEHATITKKEDSPSLHDSQKSLKGKNNTKHTSSSTVKTKNSTLKHKKMKGRVMKASNQEKPVPLLNTSLPQKVSHTTTTSLIAALVFGVIFLVAVAVQIGKPWWESLFTYRDGYNRITFLMNGK